MPKLNRYNLGSFNMMSGNLGRLYPVGLKEVLPGDVWKMSTSVFMRMAALVAPVMHPTEVQITHWFVKHQDVWDDFEAFITGGSDGAGDGATFPTKDLTTSQAELITDYYGMGRTTASSFVVSALPIRGYNLIFEEFFRDQDLQNTTDLDQLVPHKVCWNKDYFTTARPWEQKGDEVTIPMAGDIPITGLGSTTGTSTAGPINAYETDKTGTVSYANYYTSGQGILEEDTANTGFPNVRADMDNANNNANINDLREAMALHRFREERAKYGHRYDEYLRYLGVYSDPGDNGKPKYLGGGKQTISFSEVLQTAEGTNPVGHQAGQGHAGMRTNKFFKSFNEHGYIHTLMHVRPINIYGNYVPRDFLKSTRNDFYQKEYLNIGKQAITERELYADSTNTTDIFAYQDRYDEYRSATNYVAGEFRTTLDHYHMARQLAADPTLNSAWINCDPREDIFADSSEDNFRALIKHNAMAKRIVGRRR